MPIHDSGAFTGTVESLGYEELLPQQVQGTPWSEFFDPYDPTRQRMAESAWAMKGEQLGEAWGLQKGQLGSGAGMGFREARRTGIGAKRKSGLAFSGTAEEMQRTAEANVMTKYRGGLKAGETAYQQAMATGTQELAQDIYGFQEDWRREQRGTLNVLLGMDIWGDGDDVRAQGGSGSSGGSLGLGYAGVPPGGDVTPPENPSHGQSWGIAGTIVYWNADTGEWQSTPP